MSETMAHILVSLICLLFINGISCDDVPSTPSFNEKFTTALIKKFSSKPGGNLVLSPLSIETALAVASFGARGNTMSQMYEVLGYPVDQAKHLLSEKQKLINREQSPGVTWATANRIMTDLEFPLLEEYKAEVNKSFPGVSMANFDFEKVKSVVEEVNAWVSEKTNKIIDKLIDDGDIDERTKMVILNAIYFKGEWLHGFNKDDTDKDCFYSEPDQCTLTDMMHVDQNFNYFYHSDLLAEVIEFPYKDKNFSMIVVLPDLTKSNLTTVMDNLDIDELIKKVDKKRREKNVVVTFPKFEIESTSLLKSALEELGMKLLFNDAADLTGLTNGRPYVNEVIHKAKITCDEEGTVGAAGTAILFLGRSLIEENVKDVFTADHPFFYLLRDKKSGVLFAGQKVSV